jgi:hypothetical protein
VKKWGFSEVAMPAGGPFFPIIRKSEILSRQLDRAHFCESYVKFIYKGKKY